MTPHPDRSAHPDRNVDHRVSPACKSCGGSGYAGYPASDTMYTTCPSCEGTGTSGRRTYRKGRR